MEEWKGIDDLFAAGRTPQRLQGDAVANFFARLREDMFGSSLHEATSAEVRAVFAEPLDARPPFPVDVFPAPVRRFVEQVAASIGCPIDFPGVAALVVAAAAIGAARSLHIKGGWFEKPGMYAGIVAKPGQAKTPALKAVMGPVYEEQDREYQNYKAAVQRFKQQQEEQRRTSRSQATEMQTETCAAPTEPSPVRHIFASDTTTEALAVNLQNNPKGILIFHDELSAWLASMNQYRKGADRQFYLSAWSGEMVKVDRKSSPVPVVVPHPFLCVVGGIQPDLLNQLELDGKGDDGFTHRLLFAYPPEHPVIGWTDSEIDPDSAQEWGLVLSRLFALEQASPEGASTRPRILHFSDAGRRGFAEFVDRLAAEMNAPDFPPRMAGPCAKLRSYCARFALVIHQLRWAADELDDSQGEGRVNAEDVARAVRLCEYFRKHAAVIHRCLRSSQDDRQVEAFVGWLRRKGKSECTTRDVVRNNVARVRKVTQAQTLLKLAEDYGLGQVVSSGSGKKTSWTFQLFAEPDNPTHPT